MRQADGGQAVGPPPGSDVRSARVTLAPDAAAAGRARRFVTSVLEGTINDEQVSDAALAVSELVSNSVLHAGTRMAVRVAAAPGGARVEVADLQPVAPAPLLYGPDAAVGRGMAVVQAVSSSTGSEVGPKGKVVWFDIGVFPAAHPPVVQGGTATLGRRTVRFVDLPPQLLLATLERSDSLLREVSLLALTGRLPSRSAGHWDPPVLDLAGVRATVAAAAAGGVSQVDLEALFVPEAAGMSMRRLALVKEAEIMATAGEVLMPPAPADMVACRKWFYGQISLQLRGFRPCSWREPADAVGPVLSPGPGARGGGGHRMR